MNTTQIGLFARLVPGLVLIFVMAFGTAQPAHATGIWTITGSMMQARADHTATLLQDGKVLVVGGTIGGGGTILDTAELYDPTTDIWTLTGSLTSGRYQHTATLLPNGKVLVAGGLTYNNGYLVLASTELYDPITGIWAPAGSMTTTRRFHTATLLPNGKALIFGGQDLSSFSPGAELYDPSTGSWSVTSASSHSFSDHTATLLQNGKFLVVGGAGDPYAELYDPATDIWTTTGSLTQGRFYYTATLLQNGQVLVTGGAHVFSGGFDSAELYDPVTGVWPPTGSMTLAHLHHTATLLPDGKVLVVGNGVEELYDPATGVWTATASLAEARHAHTATLLSNGQVLVTGGRSNLNNLTLASAELYGPNTPDGTNVQTQPIDTNGGTTPITLTFAQVTQSGDTSLTTSSSGPPPSVGFKLGNPATYYELSTTAVFSGPVTICINYTGISFSNESNLKLNHYVSGVWVDQTISLDTTNNIICASVTSLSPFAIFEAGNQFYGFFQPVDNLPTLNVVKAGSAIPVKFSLNGDQGLNIFAAGYPSSVLINCDTGAPQDVIEVTVTAGNSSLSYNAATDTYTYTWKTEKAWTGMCRQLVVRLNDGTDHMANFRFK